jgi:hypothetical protein
MVSGVVGAGEWSAGAVHSRQFLDARGSGARRQESGRADFSLDLSRARRGYLAGGAGTHRLLVGDNRDSSHDSRHFGMWPIADVTAVARQVWFSADSRDGVRLRRIGKLLD